MSIDTTANGLTGDAAGTRESAGAPAVAYCATCGHWAVPATDEGGWRHFPRHPAPGARDQYDAGHDVVVAWCAPPAASVSPAQHEQLLSALDDAIAYREHAAASGYATAYRMLRRQLASPARSLR
jgi:hypothetical protein